MEKEENKKEEVSCPGASLWKGKRYSKGLKTWTAVAEEGYVRNNVRPSELL